MDIGTTYFYQWDSLDSESELVSIKQYYLHQQEIPGSLSSKYCLGLMVLDKWKLVYPKLLADNLEVGHLPHDCQSAKG